MKRLRKRKSKFDTYYWIKNLKDTYYDIKVRGRLDKFKTTRYTNFRLKRRLKLL